MKTNENVLDTALKAVKQALGTLAGSKVGSIPARKGDCFTILCEAPKLIDNGGIRWYSWTTADGSQLSLKQVARRGNGIVFPEGCDTFVSCCEKILEAASFGGGLTLKIADKFKEESSSRDGKNVYYLFEPLNLQEYIDTMKENEEKEDA